MSEVIHTRRTRGGPVRGFTLIELLIAIVIFAIGLFGIAGLQARGMQFTQGSQLRAIAVAQAEAMADRMRANQGGVVEGHYNAAGSALKGEMPRSFSKDCGRADCDRLELSRYDLATWNGPGAASAPQESNADVLPQGAGMVCIDSTPGDGDTGKWACDNLGGLYAIKVRWTERSVAANDQVDTDGDGDLEQGDAGRKGLFIRVLPYADSETDGIN
jgi:type IV pilus assembly protein PilV